MDLAQLDLFQVVTLITGAVGLVILISSLVLDFDSDMFDALDFIPLRSVIAFLATCGSMLFILSFSDISLLSNILFSGIVSLIVGIAIFFFVKFIKAGNHDSTGDDDMIGIEATVTLGIKPGGRGEVSCVYNGTLISRIAVSHEDLKDEIPTGSRVWISGVHSLGILEVKTV